jgi:peptidoglycan/LPS O-acetylase OafA/YrhL
VTRSVSRNPALDGLRGIAVLLVMLFHFGASVLPGGFLGVDVFFVLSGFLITGLLLKEHRASGRINLIAFWGARARRLFPALAVMLIAVALVAASMPALEQQTVFTQGIATLAYVNNWLLIAQDTSYFQQWQTPSPLLHTWSLGVEEQFYLLFPLLVLGLVLTLRRSRVWVAVTMALLALASATWGWYLATTGASIDRLYFGTDVRAQELLLGAALAILLSGRSAARLESASTTTGIGTGTSPDTGPDTGPDRTSPRQPTWLPATVGTAGVAVVLAMAAVTDARSTYVYRGGMLLLSVAVCAAIWGVSGTRSNRLSAVMGWRPLAAVGLISYGLYLWHWPLFVWLSGGRRLLNGPEVVAALVLTFAVAIPSYLLIERPIRVRRWRWEFGRTGWVAAVGAPLAIAGALVLLTPDRTQVAVLSGRPDVPAAQPYTGGDLRPRVFLVGDSRALYLRSHFSDVPDPGFQLSSQAILGCTLVAGDLQAGSDVSPETGPCERWRQQWRSDVAALRPDLGLFSIPAQWHSDIRLPDGTVLAWGSPEYESWLLTQIDETVTALAAGSAKVGIVDDTCNSVYGDSVVAANLNNPTRTQRLNELLREYIDRHPQVAYLDLSSWDCGATPEETAAKARDRKIDGLHYAPAGAVQAWEWLSPQIRTALGSDGG